MATAQRQRVAASELGDATCTNHDKHIFLPRSYRYVWPSLLLFFVCCVLTLYISREFPGTIYRFYFELFGFRFLVSMPLFGLFCAMTLARPIALMYDVHYELRCHHLIATTGLLSMKKESFEIPYEDLRGVQIDQSLIDRILGIGTLLLGTAVTDRPEIVMSGIARPHEFARLITEKIDRARLNMRGTPEVFMQA